MKSSNHFDLRDYRFKKRQLLDEPAKFSAGLVLLCYWTVPTAYQQIEFQYLSDEVIEFARIALRSRIYDVQLHRLDFLKLILSGPDQNPRSATRCLNDIFLVTGASNSVPGICGTASGQHSNPMFIKFNDKFRDFVLNDCSVSRLISWCFIGFSGYFHCWKRQQVLEHSRQSNSLWHFLHR